jgi:hypothetical protein
VESFDDVAAKEALVEPVENAVAEGVPGASGVLRYVAAGSDDHVATLGDQRVDELRRIFRRVGAVAVGHQVDVRVDVGEHAPDDVALALPRLPDDDGAGGTRAQRRHVAGIVVENID